MPHRFIRTLTGKHRSRLADIQLGIMLAFVAGAVNTAGFLGVGKYTSHMTGIVSSIATYIALNRYEAAFISFGFVLSFIGGAMVSTLVMRWGKARDKHSQFAIALLLEAVLLLAISMSSEDAIYTMVALLCFTMGLQNAIITKISNAEIRTTHVTGLATDIGIELGHYLTSFREIRYNPAIQQYKLKLHGSLLLSFLGGGIVGAMLFEQFSFSAIIPFALLLVLAASVPIADDLRKRP